MNASKPDVSSVTTSIEDFMAQAVAMEREAAQRYDELADAMEVHNNRDMAQMFRKMALVEEKHATQVMAEMGWTEVPKPTTAVPFEGFESAEMVPMDEAHYLMQPWHALQLALVAEQRAERFFAHLASIADNDAVRKAALELQQEEREHVEVIEAWLKRTPRPEANWANDPDPPYHHS
jgi:rubrerythrin